MREWRSREERNTERYRDRRQETERVHDWAATGPSSYNAQLSSPMAASDE